ncbi:hypothetical protein AB2L27_04225 [Kineococcus sp. LSe6-4]|uniref:Uncharacterized protein n=1 Tax=Kineococcus halophytocola TaxID=3234027 RepID=A0ABV4H0G5_9ACTN
MSPTRRLLLVLGAAAAFGALNALLDSTSAAPARFLGAVLNSGTAWAAVAVAAGAFAGTPRRAVLAGWLSGTVGLSAFYVVAAVLHDLPLSAYAPRIAFWWAVALVCCAPLGFVGTLLRRPGAVGLLARLVVPTGALTESLLHLPGGPVVRWTLGLLGLAGAAVALRRRGR